MKKKLKVLMVMALVIAVMMPQVAYAGWGNGRGNDGKMPYGQMKKLENYRDVEGDTIYVRNRNVKFDTPPVLKGGRTLIPVRAVTEAMGCDVEWVEPKAYIISPDKDKIIVFDLSTSKVYVTTNYTYEQLLEIEDQDIWDTMEVAIDIGPGLRNNRTYVPLRFIAEQLSLKVGYDPDTGRIDIDDEPELDPESLVVNDVDLLPAGYEVTMTLNKFSFEGIDGLVEDTDYEVDGNVVTLLQAYLESIDQVETTLDFMFEKGTVDVEKEFDITLNFISEKPELIPDNGSFTVGETEDLTITIDIEDYGFELLQIIGPAGLLVLDQDYTINTDGDEVVLTNDFLKDLVVGEYNLNFLFSRGSTFESVMFVLTVNDVPDVLPELLTADLVVDTEENLPTVLPIVFALNDFTLKEVVGLEATVDYEATGDFVITLTEAYLDAIEVPETEIDFVFKNGDVEETLTFKLTLEYLYLMPVVDPVTASFVEGETTDLELTFDLTLYGFELVSIIDVPGYLESEDYSVTSDALVLNESYLETLTEGVKVLVLIFERDDETVFVNLTVTIEAPEE